MRFCIKGVIFISVLILASKMQGVPLVKAICIGTLSVLVIELVILTQARSRNSYTDSFDDINENAYENLIPEFEHLKNGTNETINFDVFISYRRSFSRHLATLVNYMLLDYNVTGFLDVEDLRGGFWDEQLVHRLEESPNFIIILSPGTLDRCIGDFNYTDVLHQEIKGAIDGSKRIVPIFDEYDFPDVENGSYSLEIQELMRYQGVTWAHHLPVASMERVVAYLDLSHKSNTTMEEIETIEDESFDHMYVPSPTLTV